MTARLADYERTLDRADAAARRWLESTPTRSIAPELGFAALHDRLDGPLPAGPSDPAAVVDELAALVEPGLMAMGSGRFFGWVIGGTLPAALGADWLVSTWDQNAGMRAATPGVVAAEETAGRWLLDLLGLPADCAVGFVTGATTANLSCLAAARQRVLADAGWDVSTDGLQSGPRVRVVTGAERHVSLDAALRYLGLGAAETVPADDQGRIDVDDLEAALDLGPDGGPTIVCLQAGNVHSGAFDDFARAIPIAHRHSAWVHVDGAFGLWAAASPRLAHLMQGCREADSWATDAHKTLNVPYDCGVAVVADPPSMRAALGVRGAYLINDGGGDPLDVVPEMSRRARGVPVWAALRSLGRDGVAALLDRLAGAAADLATGLAAIDGVEIRNRVDYTQVCFTVGDDERTGAVIDRLCSDGTTWMSGSHWQGRRIVRVSVSNWSIDVADVEASLDAVRRAVAATEAAAVPR